MTNDAAVRREKYYEWKRLISQEWFGHGSDKVWRMAASVMETDDRDLQHSIIKDLVSDESGGLEIVLSTLDTSRWGSIDTWLPTAIDFLTVITHPALLDCLSVDTKVGTLYNFIAGTNGDRAISYFMNTCDKLQERPVRADEMDRHHPTCPNEVLPLMVTALTELLRRERRALFNSGLLSLVTKLEDLVQKSLTPEPLISRVTIMKQMVEGVSGLLANETSNLASTLLPRTTASNFLTNTARPGNRHDNDHTQISQIRILPTLEEILSDEPEYLPSTNFLSPHFLECPIQRYLDSAFRLLRHDIFGPLMDDLNPLLHGLQNRVPHHQLLRNGEMRAHLHSRASIQHICIDPRRGMEIHVSFAPPPQLKGKSKDEMRRWWHDSPRLAEGGLVCFVAAHEDKQHIVFMVVSARNTVRGSKDNPEADSQHPQSCLVVSDTHHMPSIGTKLAVQGREELSRIAHFYVEKIQGVLLDLSTLIPATYEPILRNLQHMTQDRQLAFRQWILPAAPTRIEDADAIEPQNSTDIPPPAYARKPGFRFSLKAILPDNSEDLVINPCEPENLDLAAMEARSGLDRAQCLALATALTKEYALIQGPPGTGKSHIGVRTVQALLGNKDATSIGPIIVMYSIPVRRFPLYRTTLTSFASCYTNHALDQFLAHLLKVGIANIIRIGGRSRAPELEGKNLREIEKVTRKSRLETQTLGLNYNERELYLVRAGSSLGPLHKARGAPTWAKLKHFLEHRYPLIHRQFSAKIDEEDGFTQVVARDPLAKWLKGDNSSPGHQGDESDPDVLVRLAKAKRGLDSLNRRDRTRLAAYWMQQLRDSGAEQLFQALSDAETAQQEIHQVHDECSRRTLLQADVIGLTTSGLARNINILKRLQSKVVICEEAGEVLEPHLISAFMPGLEHLIQIGDHRQLRPQINNHDLSLETASGMPYQLDRSQFERRAMGEPGMRPVPVAQLSTQRRMRPAISKLIHRIYPVLQDHETVQDLPDVVGMRENVFWLDHQHMEATADDDHRIKSHSNDWEVGMVKALVRHLIRQGAYRSEDIAVLTPYTGQLQKLRLSLSQDYEISLSDRDQDALALDGFTEVRKNQENSNKPGKPLQRKKMIESLRLATVDNFQGEEAKLVVVSLVRANKQRKIGFLRTENRINVLLSRAQHGLYLIGNTETYRSVGMWSEIYDKLGASNAVGETLPLCCPRHPEQLLPCSKPEDFQLYSPEGGCFLSCDQRLEACGHRCQSKCHSQAMHEAFFCLQPCQRIRSTCSHACAKLCGTECGRCTVIVPGTVLPCGHTKAVECHQLLNLKSVQCAHKVDKTIPECGHVVTVDCHEDVTLKGYECLAKCGEILPCGHACSVNCGACRRGPVNGGTVVEHQPCSKPCGRPFSTCHHMCPRPCHAGTECGNCQVACEVRCPHSKCTRGCGEPCAPCIEPCTWACPHQGPCTMPCAAPCTRLPCDKRCDRLLRCGHQCPSLCGEECPETYCHGCCGTEKHEARVDLFEFKTYGAINVDDTPIVVLGCGHFFTAESLDGHARMSEVYAANRVGELTDLKDISGAMVEKVPSCPDCNCPIRQFATRRYNRVVNKAVMDETSRRFLVSGREKLGVLGDRLAKIVESLQKLREEGNEEIPQGSRGYKDAADLGQDAAELRDLTRSQNQPAKKLFDAILTQEKNRQSIDDELSKLSLESPPPPAPVFDGQIYLGAWLIQIQAWGIVLHDAFEMGNKDTSGVDRYYTSTSDDGSGPAFSFLKDCRKFIDEATAHRLPRLVIPATICYCRTAVYFLRRGSPSLLGRSVTIDQQAESSTSVHYLETARELLSKALELCDSLGGHDSHRALLETIQKSFDGPYYSEITREEQKAIKEAMLTGRDSLRSHAGHWYNCANGHPVSSPAKPNSLFSAAV